ncbi:MAG TPA: alpha-amylase family glycosyl hydrolase [Candidatus Omnitrophota bacterium]|nr:alpha-amylase family glycosyl hydrolase [Candidatus Omnitrophota bacterium]
MRKYPHLLELNAFFFISRMSEKYGRKLTLATVPNDEWKSLGDQGFDYLWLMGVWKRSPGSRSHALKEPNLCHAYDLILPDWKREDVTGSPYAIFSYELDPYLGREEELLQLKMKLNGMGIGLILDFVPNHLAFDHPWTVQHPERFVSCKPETLKVHPEWSFITLEGKKLAHGRDPYFAPWIDTVQVNFWSEALRHAWLEVLLKIARVADGVRCDMAMLGLNDIFQQVWGDHIQTVRAETEFWAEVIPEVKKASPSFIFIAEVYWDLDWTLQQLGFDFTYDKRLYDRLFYDSPLSVRDHLKAEPVYRDKCLRFIENHDEERAPVSFGKKKSQAAGIVMATIPGLRFFHEGQMEGRRIRTPVHLRREPKESVDSETASIYRKLFKFIQNPITHEGDWTFLASYPAWEKSQTYLGIMAWAWVHGQNCKLVIINYSMLRTQGIIHLPEFLTRRFFVQFHDALTDKIYDRTGEELFQKGLYVDLQPWQAHLFDVVT